MAQFHFRSQGAVADSFLLFFESKGDSYCFLSQKGILTTQAHRDTAVVPHRE